MGIWANLGRGVFPGAAQLRLLPAPARRATRAAAVPARRPFCPPSGGRERRAWESGFKAAAVFPAASARAWEGFSRGRQRRRRTPGGGSASSGHSAASDPTWGTALRPPSARRLTRLGPGARVPGKPASLGVQRPAPWATAVSRAASCDGPAAEGIGVGGPPGGGGRSERGDGGALGTRPCRQRAPGASERGSPSAFEFPVFVTCSDAGSGE